MQRASKFAATVMNTTLMDFLKAFCSSHENPCIYDPVPEKRREHSSRRGAAFLFFIFQTTRRAIVVSGVPASFTTFITFVIIIFIFFSLFFTRKLTIDRSRFVYVKDDGVSYRLSRVRVRTDGDDNKNTL